MISLKKSSRFCSSKIVLSFRWISSLSRSTSSFSFGKGGGTMLLGRSPFSIRCRKSRKRFSSRSFIAFRGRLFRSRRVHFSRRISNSSNSSVSPKISKREVRFPLWMFVSKEFEKFYSRIQKVNLRISPKSAGWPFTRPKGCSKVNTSFERDKIWRENNKKPVKWELSPRRPALLTSLRVRRIEFL